MWQVNPSGKIILYNASRPLLANTLKLLSSHVSTAVCPVEHIFDFTVGDAFVDRVAGNIVNSDMAGSMEYGCAVASAKVLLVMGHTECGVVVSAIKKAEVSPNVTGLLNKIRPSVESLKYDGECSYKNHDYVNEVNKANVMRSINDVRKLSPILTDLEKEGKIKIVGAIYDIKSGEVTFL